jgi:hypothetical protein
VPGGNADDCLTLFTDGVAGNRVRHAFVSL